MRSSWHISTSGLNIRLSRTPQKLKTKLVTNCHQITSIFYMYMSLEDSFGVQSISKFAWCLEAYIYIMFMSAVDHVY